MITFSHPAVAPSRHRRPHRPLLAAVALLLLAPLTACSDRGPAAAGSGKPVVLCTIFSYYDAARAIAGDAADVQILLPPNTSPHEYHLRPQDKATAARAKLFIMNGAGLDDNFARLVDDPRATTVLTISTAIPKAELLKGEDEHDHGDHAGHEGHDHGASGLNPHIWLDPTIQIAAAEKIRDALVTLLPDKKAALEANATAYIDSLKKLDADFKAAAEKFKYKKFIGFHSAYDYLAHRYGLEQIASIEDTAGSGLTGDKLRQVIDLIKKNDIKFIAVETALSGTGANKIKQETGVQTVVLQPLETYEDPNNSYESLMRQNLEALQKILGG
jgi:zinc transport system substrate-binding protein